MKKIPTEDLEHIYANTLDIWGKLRGKSIFITGATGFFGKWLLESFIFVNHKLLLNASICALSRDPELFLEQYPFYRNEPSISFIKGDVQNFTFPTNTVYQFIIHAATDADAKLNNENPLLMLNTITEGTKKLLEFAITQPLEAFLLTSSGAVYGQQPGSVTHTKETDSFKIDINDPNSAYAEGKRIAELYCSIYNKQFGLPVKIARCFAFVGPYLPLDKHFAIGNFISNGINNEDIIIKGDGSPYRSYQYAADLVVWLWTILFNGKVNVPYNVGSDEFLNIRETAEAVSEEFNGKIKIQILGGSLNTSAHRYVPDINNTLQELKINPNINLREAIRRTIKFINQT